MIISSSFAANDTISLYHTEAVNDLTLSRTSSHSTTAYATVQAYVEPIDPKTAVFLDGQNIYNLYKLYVDGDYNTKVGDLAIDSEGNKYIVDGVQIFKNNKFAGTHTEIIAYKK